MRQAQSANASSVRDALDRVRLRRAVRPSERYGRGATTAEDPMAIGPEEVLASPVLANDAQAEGRAA